MAKNIFLYIEVVKAGLKKFLIISLLVKISYQVIVIVYHKKIIDAKSLCAWR